MGLGATRLLMDLRCAHWIQTETWSTGSTREWLAAGSVRNTKDRDMPALEVRAGAPSVERTSRDAAGLSSTNRNRAKVARTSMENDPRTLCSETRLNFSRCCSDSRKRHSKPPGKAAREQKPGNTGSEDAHPHSPSQGTRRFYPNRVF